jgi:hypothetical protein
MILELLTILNPTGQIQHGGMPTYQLGAKYPHDYIGAIDDMLRFLPRPADYLFLYFLGFMD